MTSDDDGQAEERDGDDSKTSSKGVSPWHESRGRGQGSASGSGAADQAERSDIGELGGGRLSAEDVYDFTGPTGVVPELQQVVSLTQAHSGPLPRPADLAEYAKVQADLPERIVRMAELQIEARTESMRRLAQADAHVTILGMTGVLTLSAFGLVGAFVGGVLMRTPEAFYLIALPVLGYIPRIVTAARGQPSDEDE